MTPERALAVWDTVEPAVRTTGGVARPLRPGARVSARGRRTRRTIEADGPTLSLRAFGGALAVEDGHYAPRFGERLPCPVLALRKGQGPEFGYVLAPRGVECRIDAAGADVGGRRVARRSRGQPRGGPREDRGLQPLLLARAGRSERAPRWSSGRAWVARGHEVTVVTNFPNHPTGVVPEAYRGRSFQVETVDGLRVVRCRTYATPNRGFLKKTLGHLVVHGAGRAAGDAAPAGRRRARGLLPHALRRGRGASWSRAGWACPSSSRCATCGRRSSSTSA